jgi:hypothetical protein
VNTGWIAAFLVLWFVVVLNTLLVIGLLRRIGPVLEHAEARLISAGVSLGGIPVESRVPHFRLFEQNGTGLRELTSTELLDESTLFVFMDEHCPPCKELAEEIRLVGDRLEGLPLHVVIREEEGRLNWLPDGTSVLYERAKEVTQAFQNTATPHAYLIDPRHVVLAKRIVRSLADLRAMAENAGQQSQEVMQLTAV